jgi:hypothetical protein
LKCQNVEIGGHDFFEINGCTIDAKHRVTSSSIPHGRFTALARARLWNIVWFSENERQPKADIVIRSHVHYFCYCGSSSWFALTTPALCYNSSFGIRECEGLVDIGLLCFDFDEEGRFTWKIDMANFKDMKVAAESL